MGAARDAALVAAGVGLYIALQRLLSRRNVDHPASIEPSRSTGLKMQETSIRPPFPPEIVTLLQESCLCYLGVTLDDNNSHLCLMNFTYIPSEEVIILSTRRDTTKFRAIVRMTRCTLLMHDFPVGVAARCSDREKEYGKTHSITMYGTVNVLSGEEAEKMRVAHLARHGPEYEQFIVGENIAILAVHVEYAKICNVKDEVKHWTASDSSNSPSPKISAAQSPEMNFPPNKI
jgi:hypothetical protein